MPVECGHQRVDTGGQAVRIVGMSFQLDQEGGVLPDARNETATVQLCARTKQITLKIAMTKARHDGDLLATDLAGTSTTSHRSHSA